MLCPGVRTNIEKVDLSEILPEDVEEEVKAAAEISMGTEVNILFYAPCVCVLRQMNPRPKHSGFMICSV